MKLAATLLLTCGLLGGCALGAMVHGSGPRIVFVETDADGQEVRKLTLALTEQRARTCIAGDWKRAKVVVDADKYTRDPAYTLEDGKLNVLLVTGICDAYDSYVGELSNGTFDGEHAAYGLGSSRTLGKVTGTYSP